MATATSTQINKIHSLNIKKTILFLCDMQTHKCNIVFFPQIVINSNKLLRVSKFLNMDMAITEMKDMGYTVNELGINYPEHRPDVKTTLSMCGQRLKNYLKNKRIQSVILCGIETHGAIKATAIDLVHMGISVYIIVDGCTSGKQQNRIMAFEYLQNIGCHLVTTKKAIQSLLTSATHSHTLSNYDQYNIQQIADEFSPDTGLDGINFQGISMHSAIHFHSYGQSSRNSTPVQIVQNKMSLYPMGSASSQRQQQHGHRPRHEIDQPELGNRERGYKSRYETDPFVDRREQQGHGSLSRHETRQSEYKDHGHPSRDETKQLKYKEHGHGSRDETRQLKYQEHGHGSHDEERPHSFKKQHKEKEHEPRKNKTCAEQNECAII